jgi:hypothetical protein
VIRLRLHRRVVVGILGVAILAGMAVALAAFRHNRPRSLIRRIIANPTADLSVEEFRQLETYLDTHDIESPGERRAFCEAVIERAGANMNDLLWLVVLPAWQKNRRFDEIWQISETWIRDERPGSHSILDWLASADRARACSLIDYPRVLEHCEDETLVATVLLLMDQRTVQAHRRSLDLLQQRSDMSDRVKNVATRVIEYVSSHPAGVGSG